MYTIVPFPIAYIRKNISVTISHVSNKLYARREIHNTKEKSTTMLFITSKIYV